MTTRFTIPLSAAAAACGVCRITLATYIAAGTYDAYLLRVEGKKPRVYIDTLPELAALIRARKGKRSKA